MGRLNFIQTNFSSGELSPQIAGRVDIAKYGNGVETCENFIIKSYGGVMRRPGTYYVAAAKHADKKTRLIPFQFSTTQAYIIEAGDYYMRFYKDNGRITKSSPSAWVTGTTYVEGDFVTQSGTTYFCPKGYGHIAGVFAVDLAAGKWVSQTAYEIITPYVEDDIFEIQFAQDADTMYIVHKDYAPRKLTRTAHDAWTLTAVDYSTAPNRPALMDANLTSTTITPSADTGSGITLTASTSIFDSTHVGSIWKVKSGYVKITAYTSGTVVTGNVLYSVSLATGPAATTSWSEGAWSAYRGYPSCVTFYEERLVMAASDSEPQDLWASVVGEYDNFETGSTDSDSYNYTISSDQVNAIRWLMSGKVLAMGTSGGTFSATSGSTTAPITASNIQIKKESSYGSSLVLPERIGHFVYYLQRNSRTLREFSYDYATDSYVSLDMTLLAEHITESGIVDMDYQESPDNILWLVRTDGEIATLTRQIDQQVIGWSRQTTDGNFKSVGIIPNGEEDQVWVVVERIINGSTVQYVEYFKEFKIPDEQEDCFYVDAGISLDTAKTITGITKADPGVVTAASHGFSNGDKVRITGVVGMHDINNKYYIVSNKAASTFELHDENGNDVDTSAYDAYVSGGEVRKCVSSVTGATHLALETCSVCGDGAALPDEIVSAGGVVTLADSYSRIHVGLAFTSKLKGMRLETGSPIGNAQGLIGRIIRATVRLYRSLGCKIGTESGNQDDVYFRDSSMSMGSAPSLYTGDKQIKFPAGSTRNPQYYISQTQPLPLMILCVIIYMETGDI